MHTLTNHRIAFNLRRKKAVSLKKTTKAVASDFTYDLEAMKQALNSPRIKITKADIESDESFDKWLNS